MAIDQAEKLAQRLMYNRALNLEDRAKEGALLYSKENNAIYDGSQELFRGSLQECEIWLDGYDKGWEREFDRWQSEQDKW